MSDETKKVGQTIAHIQSRSALRLAQATQALFERDRQLRKLKDRLTTELDCIEEIEARTMTPFVALFVKDGDRYKCLGVFNADSDEDIPEEWLFCIPIPNPETLQEFYGF